MIKPYSSETVMKTPECFGSRYDKNDTVCNGGYDSTYTDEENGGHVREACKLRGSCSTRTAASNMVPAQNLVRPQPPTYSRPITPVGYTPPTAYRPWTPPTQQAVIQHSQFSGNYGIPQYLSAREPVTTTTGKRFVFELLRSCAKAMGHTVAHFFDTEVFSRPQPESPPVAQGVQQDNAPPRSPS